MKKILKEQGAPKPTRIGGKPNTQQRTSTIPKELGDAVGVKKFQDFVLATQKFDKNILGPRGADSKWGPFTAKAWKNFGKMYMEYNANKDKGQETPTNTEPQTQKAELITKSKDFFDNQSAKGHFNYKTKKFAEFEKFKLPIALKVDSSEIEDKEKKEPGFFYIFPILSGDSGEFFQYDETGQNIDRGTYTLSDEDIIPGESEVLTSGFIKEQKWSYASREQKKSEVVPDTTKEDITKLRENLNYLRIQHNQETGKPNSSVDIDAIHNAIVDLLSKGWQSKYFRFFKNVIILLHKLYPNDYPTITKDSIEQINSQVISNQENYPTKPINQLSDPPNKESTNIWEMEPLNKMISYLSNINDNIYRWSNLSVDIERNLPEGLKTIDYTKIDGTNCFKALTEWYNNVYRKKQNIDEQDSRPVKNFLMRCNSACVFTNKDKGGIFKGKEQYEKVDKIIEHLRNLSGGEAGYRIRFENVDEKCKSMGRNLRSANVKTENNQQTKDSINMSIKKLVKENLNEVKAKKQRLIKEEKIISNRLSVLFERKLTTQKDYNKLFDSLIVESRFLRENGFNEQLITENWFQFLGKLGFGGIGDMLQEKFMGWILEKFGATKGSPTYDLLTIAFGNLNVDNIVSILTGNCSALTKLISKTIIETLITRAGRKMTKTEGGALEGIIRNAIDEYLTNDKDGLIANLEDKLAAFICPSISKVSDKFSSVASNLKNSIIGA
jgi:hypothetical protein